MACCSAPGITAAAVTALLDEVATDSGTPVIRDYLQEAQEGQATAVYQREELLRELLNLLSLSSKRHVILSGTGRVAGGARWFTAWPSCWRRAKGPDSFRSVVQMNETALLENPLATMRAGTAPRQRRHSAGAGHPSFLRRPTARPFPQQVNRELQKALLNDEQVIIGTATPAEYDVLSREALVRERTQRLDVPPASDG